MEIYESHYWQLTMFLQKIIGLNVFQTKWKNYIAWIYVYSFTLSFMIAMGVRLINEIGQNIDIVVENIVGEMYLTAVFAKLTINIIYIKKLKCLYRQVANDWKIIHDAEELKVLHAYTEAGRKSVTLYSIYMITGVAGFLAMPITAPLLDYIIPLENGTRPKALPYYADYGIDEEEYYYPLISQAIFGGVGTITVLVTFDLGFIMIVQHVVALFALVNYRLDKVSHMSEQIEKGLLDNIKGNLSIYKRAVSALQMHQIVIEYVDLIEECYSICWLVILFFNMVMVGGGFAIVMTYSTTCFRHGGVKSAHTFIKFFILMKLDRPEEIVRYGVVLTAGLIHFYYIFLPGQKIINSSWEVFDACYACNWYNISEKTKSLLKMMMIRSLRRCELTGGKMFILCMDTYCNMMKTGLSVFTVLNANE